MLFDRRRPHVFREFRVTSSTINITAKTQLAAIERRFARHSGMEEWALHASKNGLRVIIVEAWRNAADFWSDPDSKEPGTALFDWIGTGGQEPTPVTAPNAGVIVIDMFNVWRPLVRPVSAFNLKNGDAFNREPGCISTTVLRGNGVGRIATYARWRSEADFFAAFTKQTGKPVASTDDINAAAARMTFGFIRPDYHSYDLIASKEVQP
jgi:heme-degrading monooxygenase HmoA